MLVLLLATVALLLAVAPVVHHRRAARRYDHGPTFYIATATSTHNLALRPLTPLTRLWYRRLRIPPPLSTSPVPWPERWVRLAPYRWRWLHRRYAGCAGLFWLPCPLCVRPFGGHEWGGSIPDPLLGPGRLLGICSACTRAGRAHPSAPSPLELALDALGEEHEHDHGDHPTNPDCTRCMAWDAAITSAFLEQPEPTEWP